MYFEAIRLVFYGRTRSYLFATNKRTRRMGLDIRCQIQQKFSSGDAFNYVSNNVRRIIIGFIPLVFTLGEERRATSYSLITSEILRTVLRPVISEIGGSLRFSLLRAILACTGNRLKKNKTPTAPATRLVLSGVACSKILSAGNCAR